MNGTVALFWLLLLAGEEPATAAPPAGEVVFYATATVRERPLEDATAAVTVLDRAFLEASGATTSLDLLTAVPGVSPFSGGTAGSLSAVQLRGGDPNFTLVLLDGVAVNDGSYQVGEVFDFAGLPLAAIDRIEVVKGPLSAHYGSTGLAGVVQLFTRNGQGAPRFGFELGLGDAELRRGGLQLAHANNDFDAFAHLSYQEEEGRVAEERFALGQLQGQLRWQKDERQLLRLALRRADWRSDDYPDASGGPLYGDGALRHADHLETGASLRWQHTSSPREHRVEGSFYRHELERDSPAISFAVPAAQENTRFERGRAAFLSQLRAQTRWQLSFGGDAEETSADNRSRLFLPPFLGGPFPGDTVLGDYQRDRRQFGVFSELLLHTNQLIFELSVRQDWPDDEARVFSPRAGLVWQPPAASWRLRASWGKAYKLPSYFALASPPELGGNADLRPERSRGADFALAGDRALAGGRLTWELGVFDQQYQDLVDFDFATFRHLNRGKVTARGAEGLAEWTNRRLRLRLSLTHQKVEDEATGAGLRHRPRTLGLFTVSWPNLGRLGLHAELRFASSSLDQQIPVENRFQVEGHRLVNLAASWRLTDSQKLNLRLDNLLDENYETLIGFPGPGRSFKLIWSWSHQDG